MAGINRKNSFAHLTDEQLLRKRDLSKAIIIAFGILILLAFGVGFYLFATRSLGKNTFTTLMPVFILPVTFVPMLLSFSLLNKEIKSRNLA